MYSTTITKSNQITLTKVAREALGVKAGEQLIVETKGDSVIIRRRPSSEEFLARLDAIHEEYKTSKSERARKKYAGMSATDIKNTWATSPEGKKYIKEKYGF